MKKNTESLSNEDLEQALVVIKTLARWKREAVELRKVRIQFLRMLSVKLISYCRNRRIELVQELGILGKIAKDHEFRFKSPLRV